MEKLLSLKAKAYYCYHGGQLVSCSWKEMGEVKGSDTL
jgi:hypothetical protein